MCRYTIHAAGISTNMCGILVRYLCVQTQIHWFICCSHPHVFA